MAVQFWPGFVIFTWCFPITLKFLIHCPFKEIFITCLSQVNLTWAMLNKKLALVEITLISYPYKYNDSV